MQMSIINRSSLRNYSESVLKVSTFLGSFYKFWFEVLNVFITKSNVPIDLRLF